MRQIRAVKVIEKGEEILATYHSEHFGSRDTRQKTLLESWQFLCQCSQCSLEGKALQQNNMMRAEVRGKREKIKDLLDTAASSSLLRRRNVEKAVSLSQEMMEPMRELNLQPQLPYCLLRTALPVAWNARRLGLTAPDQDTIKQVGLEFSQEFGFMIWYNNRTKHYP